MHMKMRLFETPTAKWLLSGSQNSSTEGQLNEEALHLIRDPDLIANYSQAYESVLGSRVIPNTWRDSSAMNVLFSPEASGPRAAKKILEWLESENEQILLMVFSLRTFSAPGVGRDLTAVLRAKAAAGVPVWVITDQKQSDGIDASGTRIDPDDTTEDVLRAAGVHVYEVMNTAGPYNAMHHKTAILGRKRLRIITDTANYSKAALGSSTVGARFFVDAALRALAGRAPEPALLLPLAGAACKKPGGYVDRATPRAASSPSKKRRIRASSVVTKMLWPGSAGVARENPLFWSFGTAPKPTVSIHPAPIASPRLKNELTKLGPDSTNQLDDPSGAFVEWQHTHAVA